MIIKFFENWAPDVDADKNPNLDPNLNPNPILSVVQSTVHILLDAQSTVGFEKHIVCRIIAIIKQVRLQRIYCSPSWNNVDTTYFHPTVSKFKLMNRQPVQMTATKT